MELRICLVENCIVNNNKSLNGDIILQKKKKDTSSCKLTYYFNEVKKNKGYIKGKRCMKL